MATFSWPLVIAKYKGVASSVLLSALTSAPFSSNFLTVTSLPILAAACSSVSCSSSYSEESVSSSSLIQHLALGSISSASSNIMATFSWPLVIAKYKGVASSVLLFTLTFAPFSINFLTAISLSILAAACSSVSSLLLIRHFALGSSLGSSKRISVSCCFPSCNFLKSASWAEVHLHSSCTWADFKLDIASFKRL